MVELRAAELDAVFAALADPTRRAMVQRLSGGDRSVGELAEPFRMTLAAASKHVKALESAGLLRRTVHGRTHVCRLRPTALARAHAWLDHYQRFWMIRLDALDAMLRAEPPARSGDGPPKPRKGSR